MMSALAALVRRGILTTLTLTAGRLASRRVATAAAVSALFIMFVAHYADARGDLVRAERQLSLTAHGPASPPAGSAVRRRGARPLEL